MNITLAIGDCICETVLSLIYRTSALMSIQSYPWEVRMDRTGHLGWLGIYTPKNFGLPLSAEGTSHNQQKFPTYSCSSSWRCLWQIFIFAENQFLTTLNRKSKYRETDSTCKSSVSCDYRVESHKHHVLYILMSWIFMSATQLCGHRDASLTCCGCMFPAMWHTCEHTQTKHMQAHMNTHPHTWTHMCTHCEHCTHACKSHWTAWEQNRNTWQTTGIIFLAWMLTCSCFSFQITW